jgi:hypothetical protein
MEGRQERVGRGWGAGREDFDTGADDLTQEEGRFYNRGEGDFYKGGDNFDKVGGDLTHAGTNFDTPEDEC